MSQRAFHPPAAAAAASTPPALPETDAIVWPSIPWSATDVRAVALADAAYTAAVAKDALADEHVNDGKMQAREAGLFSRLRYRFSDERATVIEAAAETEAAKQELHAVAARLREDLLTQGLNHLWTTDVKIPWAHLQDTLSAALAQQQPSLRVRDVVARTLRAAADAADAISSAQSAETVDAVTDATFATLYSHSQTSEARSALTQLRERLQELRATLATTPTSETAPSADGLPIPNDTLDLVVDIAGITDGFDWSSWMALSQLSSAMDAVEEVQRSLKKLDEHLGRRYAPLDDAVTTAAARRTAFEALAREAVASQLHTAIARVQRPPSPAVTR